MAPGASFLNNAFVRALSDSVVRVGPLSSKPCELDLKLPLPRLVRVYLYNMGDPPGGRENGTPEHKIVMRSPTRDEKGRHTLEFGGGRFVIVGGYRADIDVWALWDAYVHKDFGNAKNAQVPTATVLSALEQPVSRHRRHKGAHGRREVVLAATSDHLAACIKQRVDATLDTM